MTKQTYQYGFIFLIFFLSSIYITIFSKSGILERKYLINRNSIIDIRINKLVKHNQKLYNHLKKLYKNKFSDQELLNAGLINKSNKIIFLKGLPNVTQSEPDKAQTNIKIHKILQEISQYRIIVIALSILIILFYYTRRPHENGD